MWSRSFYLWKFDKLNKYHDWAAPEDYKLDIEFLDNLVEFITFKRSGCPEDELTKKRGRRSKNLINTINSNPSIGLIFSHEADRRASV